MTLGQSEAAEADFRAAIALARTMRAKTLELRAMTRLARLLAQQGRRDEARTLLAEIYGWFTEGFDTRDLIDAKALLEELQVENSKHETRNSKQIRNPNDQNAPPVGGKLEAHVSSSLGF